MLKIISYEMHRTADLLIYAEDLSLEKLNHTIESLQDLLKDEKNFEPNAETPLTLSEKGFSKIDMALSALHFMDVLKRLDSAIRISSDKDLQNLNTYLNRTLRHTSGKWINLELKGNSFESNRATVIAQALTPFISAMNNLTSTPQTRSWEKEYIKEKRPEISPKEYKRLTEPVVGPEHGFDPHKKPLPIKPEKVLERSPRA